MASIEMLEITMTPDGRMDAKNAARYCGLSDKTLAMKRCDGTGPVFVKAGRISYYRADLDKWLQGLRVGSTAQARCIDPCKGLAEKIAP